MIKIQKRRVCANCGTAWFVDPDKESLASLQQLAGTAQMLNSTSNVERAVAQGNAMSAGKAVANAKQCPQCSSNQYTETDFYYEEGTPVAVPGDDRDCPNCGEKIKIKAKQCRFCQRIFSEDEMKAAESEAQTKWASFNEQQAALKLKIEVTKQQDKQTSKTGCLIMVGILFVILSFVFPPVGIPALVILIVAVIVSKQKAKKGKTVSSQPGNQ